MIIRPFSENQLKVVKHGYGDNTTCLAGGSIRSGKSFSMGVGFGTWALDEGLGWDHCLIGHSVETAMRNAGNPLMDYWRSLGLQPEFTRRLGQRIVVPYRGREQSVWVIGANNDRASDRIQGATFKGMMIDEVVLIPETFFMQAWGRLSADGAKLWCTYNPDAPRHWFKRKVVDKVDSFDGVVHNFLLRDNPSLSDQVVERYETSYTGHFHERLIKGKWVGASGLIYPTWYPIETPLDSPHWQFSLDWAVSGVFAALAINTRHPRANIVSELHYDARDQAVLTEEEITTKFVEWSRAVCPEPTGTRVWVDPSTPASFKRKLREHGHTVRNADNRVIPGIVTTSTRLASGQIRIGDCPMLKEELGAYQWDAKKSDVGEDKPTKQDDHCVDALRYYAHSTGKALRMQPTFVRDII